MIERNIICWRSLNVIALLLFLSNLHAQGGLSPSPELLDFNLGRIDHQRTAMLVLGGWAVSNIAGGAYLSNQRSGSNKYFHRMNAYWNIVNLGIAGLGYLSVAREQPEAYDLFQSAGKHYGFQNILLFNAGLDVGYIMGGLYLTERARRFTPDDPEKSDQLKGFGQAIMLQGGFLFAFDLVNYFIGSGRNEGLNLLMNGDGLGLGLVF
ncbi:hypothetical protein CEQ90_03600 [Lewinellaceae bacterium SD302]|nr:hypothetical protein CEQ90_03600 [Lewinellaceae bacterium SD302]